MTNGAQGEVVNIISKNDKPSYIMVRFFNSKIGYEQRRKMKSKISIRIKEDITPIEIYHYSYTLGDLRKNHEAKASFYQFPLKLAWSLTAHKCQGQSIVKPTPVKTDLNECFQPAMGYVILSRVESQSQMHMKEFNHKKVYCSSLAKTEVRKLEKRALALKETEWSSNKLGSVKISTINANSLHQHYKDMMKDGFITQSDIICIQETWLTENIKDESDMFHHYYINKKNEGIALLTKMLPVAVKTYESDLCSIIKATYDDFVILNVYRFSSTSKIDQFTLELIDFIDVAKTVLIVGDFNMNIMKISNSFTKVLEEDFEGVGFKQLVARPTHQEGGLIDHIYFLSTKNSCKFYESYPVFWSDHNCQTVILNITED